MRTKIVSILALVFFMNVNAQDKKWTLQECVNYALDHNISIKQQELSKDLVEEDITIAKGNFYPLSIIMADAFPGTAVPIILG